MYVYEQRVGYLVTLDSRGSHYESQPAGYQAELQSANEVSIRGLGRGRWRRLQFVLRISSVVLDLFPDDVPPRKMVMKGIDSTQVRVPASRGDKTVLQFVVSCEGSLEGASWRLIFLIFGFFGRFSNLI